MPNSLLLDNIGIDYSEEVDTPREGGMLQAMGLDSSTALAGAPAQPQSEAASLFQQAMGVSQETSKGFFERNDILPTLSDAMKTSINILKSGGPYTKEVQINDPVRKDRLKGWYDEGVNITPYEHMSYMRTGIMPKEVLENITAEREQTEAYIESKGGHLRVISDAISENPSEMALEMGKYIISNPQYLMLPMAYAATAARVAVSTGKTAARTAGVAAEVGVGAGIAAGGAALTTRQQEGIVDPQEVKNAAMVGGGAGFLLGTGQAILRPLKGAGDLVQNKTGIISEDVQAQIIRYSQKHKVSMQVATAKVVENYNLDPYPIVAELNKVAGDLEKTLVPEGPFVGPKTKRQIMQEKVSKKAEAEMAGRDPTASFVENRSVVDVPPEPPGRGLGGRRSVRGQLDRVRGPETHAPPGYSGHAPGVQPDAPGGGRRRVGQREAAPRTGRRRPHAPSPDPEPLTRDPGSHTGGPGGRPAGLPPCEDRGWKRPGPRQRPPRGRSPTSGRCGSPGGRRPSGRPRGSPLFSVRSVPSFLCA